MTDAVQSAKSSFIPNLVKGVSVCAVVVIVAEAVHGVWGKTGLFYYGAVIFAAYQYGGPVIHVWKRVELKGVLIAVLAIAFPIIGYSSTIASAYLVGCIGLYQWQQIKTIETLEGINRTQTQQLTSLEELNLAQDQVAQQMETQLLEATKGSEELQRVLAVLTQTQGQIANARQAAEARQARMALIVSSLRTFREAIQSNPQQTQLLKLIDEWTVLTEQAKRQAQELEEQKTVLRAERERFQATVQHLGRATHRHGQSVDKLTEIVTGNT